MADYFSSIAVDLSKKQIISSSKIEDFFNPDPEFQKIFCGSSMRDAYLFGAAFANILATKFLELEGAALGQKIAEGWKVLDFGCGWGRISRLMARKFGQAPIYGLDVNAEALAVASLAMPKASFSLIDNFPPAPLRDNLIDIAFSVSVFSHLNEEFQKCWADELHRMIRSGGLLFVTYHGPWLMNRISDYERDVGVKDAWHSSLAEQASFLEKYRQQWELGKFTYMRTGGSAMGGGEAYGDVLVPESWAREMWVTAGFEVIEWIEDKSFYPQCIAILRNH